MKAVIYIRTSTSKQALEGNGHKHQLQICLTTAQQFGYHTTEIYYDENISGSTPLEQRTVLHMAVESLNSGDIFIVSRINRLARNNYFSLKIVNAIRARGARIVSASEPECNKQESGEIAHYKAASRAEYERELYLQGTQASIHQKRQNNRCIGTVKYGYQRSANFITLEQNRQEQEIIELIKQLYSFDYSPAEITREVNAQGFRSRNNTPFQVTQIQNIIKNNCLDIKRKSDSRAHKKVKIVPYGYRYNLDTQQIEPFAPEQEVIAWARQLRSEGLSLRSIAETFNNAGYRNQKNGLFTKNQIAKMFIERNNQGLRRDFYTKKKRSTKPATYTQALYTAALELRQEGYSFTLIAQELTKRGYKTKRKKALSTSYIYSLLKAAPQVSAKKTVGKSHVPYGFTYDQNSLEIIPCTKEQTLIAFVYALDNQGAAIREIITQLHEKGYTNRAGKPFQPEQLYRILKRKLP
jgi:DNA invertase Pin-like site-specific DNA recombinase